MVQVTMTSVSLLATFSTAIVSEFASDTDLMRDSSQSYPLCKSNFFSSWKERRGICFTWLFIHSSNIVKICWVFRTILYLRSRNIYLILFSFKYCNHWSVKMRGTEIKIIFFLWLKGGRILYSFCCLSNFFLGEIQLPVVLSVISKIVETRAGLMPNRNYCDTVGFAEIPCLNLRCQSRFKVLSY